MRRNAKAILASYKKKDLLIKWLDWLGSTNLFVVLLIPILTYRFLFWFLDVTNVKLCSNTSRGFTPIMEEGFVKVWFFVFYIVVLIAIYYGSKLFQSFFGVLAENVDDSITFSEVSEATQQYFKNKNLT